MITHIFILIQITLNTTEHNNNAITASDTFLHHRKAENNDKKQEADQSQKSISSHKSNLSRENEYEDHDLDDIKTPNLSARMDSGSESNRDHQVSPLNEELERDKNQSSAKVYNDGCLGGLPARSSTPENLCDNFQKNNSGFTGYNKTLLPERNLYVLDEYFDNYRFSVQVEDDQTNGYKRFKNGMNFPEDTKINDNNHICDEFSSNSQFKNNFSKSKSNLEPPNKRVEKEERKQDINGNLDWEDYIFSNEPFLDSQSQNDKGIKNKKSNISSKRKDEGHTKDNLSNHEIKPSLLTLLMVTDTPSIVDKNYKFEEKEQDRYPFCKLQLNLDLLEFKEIDIGGEKMFSLPKEAFSLEFSLFTHSMYPRGESRNYFKNLLRHYILWEDYCRRLKPHLTHKLKEDLLFERAIEPEEKSRESGSFVRKYQSKRISACFNLVDLLGKFYHVGKVALIKSGYDYLVYFFIDFFVYENKSESGGEVGSDTIKKYSYYIKNKEGNFFGQNIYCVIRKREKDEQKNEEDIKNEILDRWGYFKFEKTHMIV